MSLASFIKTTRTEHVLPTKKQDSVCLGTSITDAFPGKYCFTNTKYQNIPITPKLLSTHRLGDGAINKTSAITLCHQTLYTYRDVLHIVQDKTLNVAFTTVYQDLRICILFKANVISRKTNIKWSTHNLFVDPSSEGFTDVHW